ncbi:protein AF-9 [Helicoverpa armigera]|uniref:protein AF-9 n=1 Tax=Helicoverpa armigera TaxID=29058 RepID=UPI003083A879
MSAIKVNFEIGHEASLRSKKTPEGFTHDWEVFVRGQEGADISHFVDKVVFLLHETFKKPRRVVKEPPFTVKESGYAGFMFPIEIYLKNKDEPKKIKFSYDFTLQQSGFLKDRYIFQNPNEEFRKKLLKGGGIPISNNAFYTNPDQESRSRDSFTEEKQQLVSKPKLSSENIKKHKSKEHKEEVPHKTTSSFENLFGPPLQKPPKVSPDPKKLEKSVPPVKSDKKDKERSSSDKKQKHEHKEIKMDKMKVKEDKDKGRPEKIKNHTKDVEKQKDKNNKRPIERPPSPDMAKKRCLSPIKRALSPPRSSSASSIKDDYKPPKHSVDNLEQKKSKIEDKSLDVKIEKELKEKKKKEKKSHDRDKERKEKKEHKKESHKLKESPKEPPKETPKEVPKIREAPKEKEPMKDSPMIKEKPTKPDKSVNKFSLENLRKTPPPDEERTESHKSKEKGDPERKHKHKKKDKKRDESREKHKESSKEKKHKHEKVREIVPEKIEIIERRETPIPKERPLPEPASPISIDTASQCSSKSGLAKSSHIGNEDVNSSHSDSESSVIADEEDTKVKIENPSPEPIKHEPSPEPEPEPEIEPEPELEPEPEPVVEPPPPHKEKKQKHKDKSAKREEKRRKRKAAEEERDNLEILENRKIAKTSENAATFNDTERGESSGSTSVETKVQDNGVSSSLGEDAEPGDLSPDYMVQLRDLQQRIMKIKNNEDLERVVNLIAETGRYEVTTQTFDFDLCLLDRSTVQQLIQLVGC